MRQPSRHNDQELLLLLKSGNESAFREIYDHYWEPLLAMAHKRLQSLQDAEEIIQNVFVSLWQKRDHLEIDNLPFYLAGMVRFMVYRHLGNMQRQQELRRKVGATILAGESTDIDNRQLLDILTRLSNDLPEHYRVIFIHHKLLDRPLEEVAKELGVSPRTAERYVGKVMEIMRRHRDRLAITFLLL